MLGNVNKSNARRPKVSIVQIAGNAKREVDEAESERGEEGLEVRKAGFLKDGGGVEGDDVDATHLLGDHDGEGGQGRATDTGNGEELGEACEVIAAADDFALNFELDVDVIHVSGCLKGVVTELKEGAEGLWVFVLLYGLLATEKT